MAVPTQNSTGSTLCVSDNVEQVTLAAAPASGNNRIDLIICQPRGNDLDGGSNNDFIFTSVTGTAAASPTVPPTPPGALTLAQIYVPGGSASVTAGNITDVRPGSLAVASGLWIPVTAFAANWSNFASGYRTCAWRVDANRRVTLRGMATTSVAIAAGGNSTIFTLPSGARPVQTEIFVAEASNLTASGGVARLDVNTTGIVSPSNATSVPIPAGGWVSLSGLSFDADGN
jgi:hypothetical protein